MLFLVPEVDCLRVYSSLKHEIIRAVPQSIVTIYSPDSNSCGRRLFELYDEFQNRKSDVSLLRGESEEERKILKEGIIECLEAASEDLSTIYQQKLLKCAQFGKCFFDGMIKSMKEEMNGEFEKEEEEGEKKGEGEGEGESIQEGENQEIDIVSFFQETTHHLRVLNTLRDDKVIFESFN